MNTIEARLKEVNSHATSLSEMPDEFTKYKYANVIIDMPCGFREECIAESRNFRLDYLICVMKFNHRIKCPICKNDH